MHVVEQFRRFLSGSERRQAHRGRVVLIREFTGLIKKTNAESSEGAGGREGGDRENCANTRASDEGVGGGGEGVQRHTDRWRGR